MHAFMYTESIYWTPAYARIYPESNGLRSQRVYGLRSPLESFFYTYIYPDSMDSGPMRPHGLRSPSDSGPYTYMDSGVHWTPARMHICTRSPWTPARMLFVP